MKNYIKIAGLKIKFVYFDSLENGTLFGQYLPDKQEIQIEKNLDREREIRTRIHEVIEVINKEYDIGLNHKQINLLEVCLYDLKFRI